MDSVDKSPAAAGAREINVLMREVVREVQNAKAFEKEADALTFVLDRIHKDFPPSRLDAMSEGESVETMRTVLAEIRAEMRTLRDGSRSGESAETPETDDAASNDSTASAADSSSADETRKDWHPYAKNAASVAEETATEPETETETEKPPPVGTSVGKRAVSLTDLASLARSNEAAPPESIWEAARREKRAEKP